ncbi:hypothetical protein AGR1B_pAt30480 [Agrobacterium fabacearum S56]|nr:hypothetical protein AGR1B_pAt30480 [Agrobacterium fabacearum S56]
MSSHHCAGVSVGNGYISADLPVKSYRMSSFSQHYLRGGRWRNLKGSRKLTIGNNLVERRSRNAGASGR